MKKLLRSTVVLIALLSRAAGAQDVGWVTHSDTRAELGRPGSEVLARDGANIEISYELGTDGAGRMQTWFDDPRIRVGNAEVEFTPATRVRIVEGDAADVSLVLLSGRMHLVGRGEARVAHGKRELKLETVGTEFIAEHDPAEMVTRVTVLSGLVLISDLSGWEVTAVSEGHYIEIRGANPPEPARELSEGQMAAALVPFDFIGHGRAESQSAWHPALTGVTLPGVDQAPRGSGSPSVFTSLDAPVTQPPQSLGPARLEVQF